MASSRSSSRLAGAFEATLVLAAGRFNGTGTDRALGQLFLPLGGVALLAGIAGLKHLFVLHPVGVVLEVFNLGLKFLPLGLQQTGFEFGQGGNDRDGLVVADLLKQRCHPCWATGVPLP